MNALRDWLVEHGEITAAEARAGRRRPRCPWCDRPVDQSARVCPSCRRRVARGRSDSGTAGDVDEPDAPVGEGRLTEAEILEASPLVEESAPRVLVTRRGRVFDADGTVGIAIIRPCVSRGKRLRGLPPIYTPEMLAENAGVFAGWLMYADHLSEAAGDAPPDETVSEEVLRLLEAKGRSVRDLGGRILSSRWDPRFRAPYDDEYGYRPGAVVGRALPQPFIREMIEADPELLHVSINAYPKGARPGAAPWDRSQRGMLVEGILTRPPGSVDWVPRGGAGGRVLREVERPRARGNAWRDFLRESGDLREGANR